MQSLVVFFALASVVCGSIIPWAQPAHQAALVLDPHGRSLDTAAVINARAIHLQAKALEPVSHAAVVAHAAPVLTAAPVLSAHGLATHGLAAPLLSYSTHGFAGYGHLLKKRSLGHWAYSAPLVVAPSAVSHQSRVDVVSNPAIVSHAVAAPVISHAVAAPVLTHAIAPSAISHQSRVDVRTSPAVTAHGLAAPLLSYSAHGLAGYGHLLKKRSLGHWAYSAPLVVAPSAVSHQSRVDVVSSPAIVSHAVAAPVISHAVAAPVLTHAIAPAAVSHQSRVDVRSSPAITISSAPLLHAASWAHGAGQLVHGW